LPDEIEGKGDIMRRHGFQTWYDIADSLAEEEIVALMKAFTIAEKTLKGWEAGSVSPVGWLGRKLVERNEVLADKVAKWVVSYTDNPYLPFGRCNAKTVQEYKEKPFKDYMRYAEAEEKIRSAVAERRKEKARLHKLLLEKQSQYTGQRKRLLEKLDKLSPVERITYIAKDEEHPIDYYSSQYADVELDVINSISPEIKKRLIEKIGVRHKGVWKKLADKLSER
jgi:hypothetical protein